MLGENPVGKALAIATVIMLLCYFFGGMSGMMWAIAISTVIGLVVSFLNLILEIFL